VAPHIRYRWSNIVHCLAVKQVTLVHQLGFQLKTRQIDKYQQVGPTESYTVSDTQLEVLLGRQQPSNCLTCIQNRCSHILWQGPPLFLKCFAFVSHVCAFDMSLCSLVFSILENYLVFILLSCCSVTLNPEKQEVYGYITKIPS
jgi:hypothetical protein